MKYLFIVLIVMLVASCQTYQEKSALADIEMLMARTDSVQNKLETVNIDSAIFHYRNLNQFQQLLGTLQDVNLNHEDTLKMLKLTAKLLKGYTPGITKFKKREAQLEAYKATLGNFHHDVSKGLVPNDSLQPYVKMEKEKLKRIERLLDNSTVIFVTEKRYQDNKKEIYRFYDHILTGIDEGRYRLKKSDTQ